MNYKIIYSMLIITLINFSVGALASNIDDVYFSSRPIEMIISTKEDSLIYFPSPVKLKDDFGNHADVIITKDVVVIKALGEFSDKRFIFKEIDTDQVYIFNISANNAINPRHVRLLLPKDIDELELERVQPSNPYVLLSQHASMSLYYPERYKPKTSGVYKVKTMKEDASYFVAFNGGASPVAAWKGFGYFITAVEVVSYSQQDIELDPRIHFRGDWNFISYQHSWLGGGVGSDTRKTTVYVVSERPFWESLL